MVRGTTWQWIRFVPAVALAVAACGGGDPGVQIGPPSRIEVALGGEQVGVVGSALATAPAVRVTDAAGRGVQGIGVRFQVGTGGGTVSGGDSVVTNADGIATVGQWRLGATPGLQQLQATAIGLSLQTIITATASAGPPASVQAIAGGVLSAVVGTPVFPAPSVRVRDGFGNPIAGAEVTFLVTLGGGTVTGGQQLTDAEGRATVGGWTLGPLAGNNRMIARTSNGLIATFNATGLGIPSVAEAASPVDQAGVQKFGIPVLPRLRVRDQQGQGVPGLAVVFTRTVGDGTVTGDTAVTDNQGVAAPRDYRLGTAPNHAVVATVIGAPNLDPVEFRATAAPRPFTIDVRFITEVTPNQRDVFIAAALRWMDVIVGDLVDVPVNLPAFSCFGEGPALNETIDDLVIFAKVQPDDGPGGVLGRAGYCRNRTGTLLPYLGFMEFDSADLPTYETTGRLLPLILHEMGHVLGIGTLWVNKGLLQDAGGGDPTFSGVQAGLAWPTLGVSYAGVIVPVENTGGQGTRDSHWRESVLDREVMTGFIEAAGIAMPLSRLTGASLIDLGYTVDLNATDAFAPATLRADGTRILTPGKTPIREILLTPEGKILPGGKFVPHDY